MTRLVLHTTENGRRRQRTLPPPRDWPSRWGDLALLGALFFVVGCLVFALAMLAFLGIGK